MMEANRLANAVYMALRNVLDINLRECCLIGATHIVGIDPVPHPLPGCRPLSRALSSITIDQRDAKNGCEERGTGRQRVSDISIGRIALVRAMARSWAAETCTPCRFTAPPRSTTPPWLRSFFALMDVTPPGPWLATRAPTRFTSWPALATSVPPGLLTYRPATRSMRVSLFSPAWLVVVVLRMWMSCLVGGEAVDDHAYWLTDGDLIRPHIPNLLQLFPSKPQYLYT